MEVLSKLCLVMLNYGMIYYYGINWRFYLQILNYYYYEIYKYSKFKVFYDFIIVEYL